MASLAPPPPPPWVLDLNTPSTSKPKMPALPDPPGFTSSTQKRNKDAKSIQPPRKAPSQEELDTLKLKKAWELAIAPAKQLPMNAIGMYMTGNSLQIFSIFMVFTLFKTPLQAIMNLNNTFSRLESEGTRSKMWQVKVVFVACNLLAVALGLWKVDKMGLLPTTRSDWLAWESARQPLEIASPAWA